MNLLGPWYVVKQRDSDHWLTVNNDWSPNRSEAMTLSEEQASLVVHNAPTAVDMWRV